MECIAGRGGSSSASNAGDSDGASEARDPVQVSKEARWELGLNQVSLFHAAALQPILEDFVYMSVAQPLALRKALYRVQTARMGSNIIAEKRKWDEQAMALTPIHLGTWPSKASRKDESPYLLKSDFPPVYVISETTIRRLADVARLSESDGDSNFVDGLYFTRANSGNPDGELRKEKAFQMLCTVYEQLSSAIYGSTALGKRKNGELRTGKRSKRQNAEVHELRDFSDVSDTESDADADEDGELLNSSGAIAKGKKTLQTESQTGKTQPDKGQAAAADDDSDEIFDKALTKLQKTSYSSRWHEEQARKVFCVMQQVRATKVNYSDQVADKSEQTKSKSSDPLLQGLSSALSKASNFLGLGHDIDNDPCQEPISSIPALKKHPFMELTAMEKRVAYARRETVFRLLEEEVLIRYTVKMVEREINGVSSTTTKSLSSAAAV